VNRLAVIITAIAAMLSGGGVARYAHMIAAHGGQSCASACDSHRHAHGAPAGFAAAVPASNAPAHGAPAHDAPAHDAPTQGDCPVCDELAMSAPAPLLHSPFIHVIALLAIVHDREAGRLAECQSPDAVAARPPPARA